MERKLAVFDLEFWKKRRPKISLNSTMKKKQKD